MLGAIATIVVFSAIALFFLAKFVSVSAGLLFAGAVAGFIAAAVLAIIGIVALANKQS